MALKLRRGTDAERQNIRFAEGEPVYVTDTGELYVGDGVTLGGNRIRSGLSAETDPSLGGDLDLAGNNIVGTGNIAIEGNIFANGNITATGNINLGNGVEDNVVVGGQISSSLIPDSDGLYNLGAISSNWREGFFEGLTVNGEIVSETININRVISNESSVIYSSDTDTLSVSTINVNNLISDSGSVIYSSNTDTFSGSTFIGDVVGSVFGEDSQVIVDTTDSSINTPILKIKDSDFIVQNNVDGINIISNQGVSVRANDIDGSTSSNLLLLESAITGVNGLTSPNPGDNIGGFGSTVFDETVGTYQAKTLILSRLDTGVNGSFLDFVVEDSTGQLGAALSLKGPGIAESNIFKTGTYQDETQRDSAIPNPEKGMIIFLEGHDDSSGSPKFQGYDGNAWRDFN